jgi:hypothetical protein
MFLRSLMRPGIPRLTLLFLLFSSVVAAELSVTSKWRIEQAIQRCHATDNALTYAAYWGNSVTEGNRETVCIAEHFAQLANWEGDEWLEEKAPVFISSCRVQAQKNDEEYSKCLQNGVRVITQQISSSCKELGEEGLWDESRCKDLISYIFITKFDKILLAQRPFLTKVMDNKVFQLLCHPITAILFLILFVIDVLVWIDPGNWMRVSKMALFVGSIISLSFFLKGQWRFLGMGIAVLTSVGAITWNHITAGMKSKRKVKKKK